VERSKGIPTGIHTHRIHLVVRLGSEHTVRIQFNARDEHNTHRIPTAPLSHSIARALYSSVADFSTNSSQIAECLAGVIGFTWGHNPPPTLVDSSGAGSSGVTVRKTKPPIPNAQRHSPTTRVLIRLHLGDWWCPKRCSTLVGRPEKSGFFSDIMVVRGRDDEHARDGV